ncbi:MAG: HDOD domain-containing protein [Solirubrobacterales bacterium]|nr:HDOD domain-containing protein [Solirubrobacterales bacterium]
MLARTNNAPATGAASDDSTIHSAIRGIARHACRAPDAIGALVVQSGGTGGRDRVIAAYGVCESALGRTLARGTTAGDVALRAAADASAPDRARFRPPAGRSPGRPEDRLATAVIASSIGPWGELAAVAANARAAADIGAGLEELAGLAAAAIDAARMRRTDQETLDAGIAAFGRLLDLRDGYTSRHTDEVAELSLLIARRMEFDPVACRDLLTAARLHDLGKIGVPDRVLHKPGPLSADDWAVMRCHPEWGADALSLIPGLGDVAGAIRAHHERWDGQGYPDGLAGEAAPLAARIIAVCDAFHAMLSDRPYRKALEPAAALAQVRDGAGTQFDPGVVRALLEVLPGPQGSSPAAVANVPARGREPRLPRSAEGRAAPASGRRPGHALLGAFDRVGRLAALREPHGRALDLLSSGEPSIELVRLIESDVALTAAMLRIAGRIDPGARPGSVGDALTLLGPDRSRKVLLAVPTADFFQRVSGWSVLPEHHRLHALATQKAAERVARVLDRDDRDQLLAAALLHDIGKLVLEDAYPRYPDAILAGAVTPEQRVQAERRELGMDHTLVAGVLLRRWELHPDLVAAVQGHHDADATGAAGIVRLADLLARYAHARTVDPAALLQASRSAGVDASKLRAVMFDLSQPMDPVPRPLEPSPLSAKEERVLRGLASGNTYKGIAADLGLSTSTIRSHCHNIYNKLDVMDRANAVLLAAERGWI